jgi:hypothetical protein
MSQKNKKTLLATIGSILIGIGVIWGVIGFHLNALPFLLILIICGCICSYFSKRIKA